MRWKTKTIVGSAALGVVAIVVPIIGPFTFYETVVPVLSPILARPEGVPRDAKASYNWKVAGLSWSWQDEIPNGCVKWRAADSHDYYDARLTTGTASCESNELPLTHASHSEAIVFGEGGDWAGGEACPFSVTNTQLEKFRNTVREAMPAAEPSIEKVALQRIASRLRKTDGQRLTTDVSGGCNDLKPSDYGK